MLEDTYLQIMKSAFEIFNCSLDDVAHMSPEQLRTVYKRKALEVHPDKGGKESDFCDLQWAFEILNRRAAFERHAQELCPAIKGTRVQVHSLQRRHQFNGCRGYAGYWSGLRLEVFLILENITIAVKAHNVAVVTEESHASAYAEGAQAYASASCDSGRAKAEARTNDGAARAQATASFRTKSCPWTHHVSFVTWICSRVRRWLSMW